MYAISVAILSQGCSLVKVVSAKMTALEDALALLGLQLPFTSSQLRKQYHRYAKIFHPDKEGGDVKKMQRIVAANEFLQMFAENDPMTVGDTDQWQDYYPPSPGPSATDILEAIMHGKEFLEALHRTPKSSQHRGPAMQLWHSIHQASNNLLLKDLLQFGAQSVWMLADYLSGPHVGDPSTQSWTGLGYKYLSFQGFDVDGMRIIDYGNKEYHALLQFWALAQPTIHVALNRLRCRWPTLMDLWLPSPKSAKNIERLADVMEIIMGATRAEPWFHELYTQDQYRHKLPALFLLLTTLCKIIQSLSARLKTGYLKHKNQIVPKFEHLQSLEFSCKWRNNYYAWGLLLFGLVHSSGRMPSVMSPSP